MECRGAARSEVDSFQSGLVSDPVRATPSKSVQAILRPRQLKLDVFFSAALPEFVMGIQDDGDFHEAELDMKSK